MNARKPPKPLHTRTCDGCGRDVQTTTQPPKMCLCARCSMHGHTHAFPEWIDRRSLPPGHQSWDDAESRNRE